MKCKKRIMNLKENNTPNGVTTIACKNENKQQSKGE